MAENLLDIILSAVQSYGAALKKSNMPWTDTSDSGSLLARDIIAGKTKEGGIYNPLPEPILNTIPTGMSGGPLNKMKEAAKGLSSEMSVIVKGKKAKKINLGEDVVNFKPDRGGLQGLPDDADTSKIWSLNQLQNNRVKVALREVEETSYGPRYHMDITSPRTATVKDGVWYRDFDLEKKWPEKFTYDSSVMDESRNIIDKRYKFPKDIPELSTREPSTTHMYRGMSGEEMDSILTTGEIKSHGAMNLSGQEGTTLFSNNPDYALSYASGFSPWYYKPTYSQPSYVIEVKKPSDAFINSVKEIEIPGSLPKDDITRIWEIRVGAEDPGSMTLYSEYAPWLKEGSRSDQTQRYIARDVTSELLKGSK